MPTVEKYGTQVKALALIHCTVDDSQITDARLRAFLHRRARHWCFNDLTSNPLHCTDLPRDYQHTTESGLATPPYQHPDATPSPANSTSTEWASGQDVVCPTFAGGDNPLAECVFTNPAVQHAVLAFFEDVTHGGGGGGGSNGSVLSVEKNQTKDEDWEPQVEGPKVPFAGTMVESELLKAAGLVEGAE